MSNENTKNQENSQQSNDQDESETPRRVAATVEQTRMLLARDPVLWSYFSEMEAEA